ncbi:MAG: hypothetical protein M3Z54_05795 [Gemmatimonadota bacterium]|nr:hypothetical protein [Gemmatimonadota bacterium]
MQAVSFTCSDCKERIEDQRCPVAVYIVAGLAPLHPLTREGKGHADVTDYPMPQIVRDLLAEPVARLDFCPDCLGKRLSLPLIDKDGKKVEAAA